MGMVDKAGQWSIAAMFALFAIMLWGLEFTPSSAIKTYAMEEECGQELSLIFDTVYQGRLVFKPQTSNTGVCTVTIESWYSMPQLMFYLTHLNVSCDDGYIEFGDGRANGEPIAGLPGRVCGVGKEETPMSIYLTQSQYLKVTFTRVRPVLQSSVLTVIFTSYSVGNCRNDQYKCSNGRCIHDTVKCNGHNSCGDKSDCKRKLSSVTTAGIVAASLVGICILATIITMVVYHCYCKKKVQNQRPNARMLYTNTRSIGHHDDTMVQQGQTMSIISGQQPAYPRHWTGNHGYSYTSSTRPQVSVNTNVHYWVVTDRSQTENSGVGQIPPPGDVSRDNNTESTTHFGSDNPVFEPDTSSDSQDEHVGKSDAPDDKSIVYYEDEIIMEDNVIEAGDNSESVDKHAKHTDNKTHDYASTQSDSCLVSETNEPDDRKVLKVSSVHDLTPDPSGFNNVTRVGVADTKPIADEIDKTFEDFCRDLMPNDSFGDDILKLNDSTDTEEKDTGGNKESLGTDNAGFGRRNALENQVFSTDI